MKAPFVGGAGGRLGLILFLERRRLLLKEDAIVLTSAATAHGGRYPSGSVFQQKDAMRDIV